MLKDIFDFKESDKAFEVQGIDLQAIDFNQLKLLVKAHEKEIYDYGEGMIIARPHKDNQGTYPFSKMDFLSHKLLELIMPDHVPKVYAAYFDEDECFFVLEKIDLDPLHKAYNISRQKVHQGEGLSYAYDPSFLNIDENTIETLASQHFQKVESMQKSFSANLSEYGITFDHSQVNITWNSHLPIALELHKCQRKYLFDYDQCLAYIKQLEKGHPIKEKALALLDRIKELALITTKETYD